MKLKKRMVILSICFLIKDLNPFFYELVRDSIKIPETNLIDKTQKFSNLKISSKTLALFTLYLNIFSTIKLNIQQNTKEVKKRNMFYSISKQQLLEENSITNTELNYHIYRHFFFSLYLNRDKDNINSVLEARKSIQILKSFNNI